MRTEQAPEVDVVFRGAALTLSGTIQQTAVHTAVGGDGWEDYFELEAVHCGSQDISDIIEPGSNAWIELEALANRRKK